MFTGIVTDVGTVSEIERHDGWLHLRVAAPATAVRVAAGSSVAVNGVCLTVNTVDVARGEMDFSILPITLVVTRICEYTVGDLVNLECALRVGDEIGGHFVYGHVDGIGTVTEIKKEDASVRMSISMPKPLRDFRAHKGAACVDGVSLTMAALTADGCEVCLVEYTLQHTTLSERRVGDAVHLEMDMLLKACFKSAQSHADLSPPQVLEKFFD